MDGMNDGCTRRKGWTRACQAIMGACAALKGAWESGEALAARQSFFRRLFKLFCFFYDFFKALFDSLETFVRIFFSGCFFEFLFETSQDQKPRSAKDDVHGRIDLLTKDQIYWCNEHCNFDWFVEDDGKVCSKDESICFKNINSIVLFPVDFGNSKDFDCSRCPSLKSLRGAPERVNGDFKCYFCNSLVSLEGSPKNVGGDFTCSYCDFLQSLKGAPKRVEGNFDCFECESLESLEGTSKSIGGNFFIICCHSLESLDELKNTRIDENMIYHDCPKLEKYDPILSDMSTFRRWQKSDLTVDEFMKEYDGYIEAKKYGI